MAGYFFTRRRHPSSNWSQPGLPLAVRVQAAVAPAMGSQGARLTVRFGLTGVVRPRCGRPRNVARMRLPALLYRVYEGKLTRDMAGADLPHHVGVMLDGNRRWAREKGFTDPNEGHRAGAAHIDEFLNWCQQAGIPLVTLWLLSTENLHRPSEELDPLLAIICDVVDELAAPGEPWRLRLVGALDRLPDQMQTRLRAAELRTTDRKGAQVNIAVGYGGRQEISDAVRSLLRSEVQSGKSLEQIIDGIDVEAIGEHLYTSGQPDPDLVIRTSGEQRLSGFLMWQSVHTEFWFCDAFWPDFRRVDFLRALRDYAARHRRFGA